MKWFYDLKIKSKLTAAFSLTAAITVFIGYLGITNMHEIDQRDTELYENMTVPISLMGNIAETFQRIRINTRDIILANEPSEIEGYVDIINQYRASIDKDGKLFEERIVSEEVKDAFEHFLSTRKDYLYHVENLYKLARINNDAESFAYLNGDMRKAADEEMDAIQKLNDMKVAEAKKMADMNTAQANSATTIMIILLSAGVVLSIFLGLFISNYISKGVLLIKDRMSSLETVCINNLEKGSNQLSEGDLNIKIVTGTLPIEVKAKDELGALSENVNAVIAKTQATVDSVDKAVSTIKEVIVESNGLVKAALDGNLEKRGNTSKFKGSYKELVEGLNNTFDAVVRPINESKEVLARAASGDLTSKMKGEYTGDYELLKSSINQLTTAMSSALHEVSEAVQATASAANEISASSEQMATGAHEQSQQTTEVASAVEELSKTIIETTKSANLASDTLKKATSTARSGGEIVNKTIEGMNRIAEVVISSSSTIEALGQSSNQIGEIIQVIDDIADQTNLLALNAAIEAARAGEQGRGFAVVADEVRKLAERTTKATKEIAGMIKKIQQDTTDAVTSIKRGTDEVQIGKELAVKSGQALEEIIIEAGNASDLSMQTVAANEQMSASAEQISRSMEGISSVTQESAASTEQIARTAEDLNKLTLNLQELVGRFKLEYNSSPHSAYAVRKNGKLVHA